MSSHVEPRRDKSGNFPTKSVMGDGVEDITQASGQSSKSERMSRAKAMLDMSDGDEHFNIGSTTVAPINDLYLSTRMLSAFGTVSCVVPLVTDTKINRR